MDFKPSPFRSDECNARYKEFIDRKLPFMAELVRSSRFYKIFKNTFPYDRIASSHHLLFSKQLSNTELMMLAQQIVDSGEYDMLILNAPKRQSLPEEYHIHLLRLK